MCKPLESGLYQGFKGCDKTGEGWGETGIEAQPSLHTDCREVLPGLQSDNQKTRQGEEVTLEGGERSQIWVAKLERIFSLLQRMADEDQP